MGSLMDALTRWRNSRGFGVHSPFGYYLARMVVNPRKGYAYYGYSDIRRAAGRGHAPLCRRAEMLLRLLVFLRPSSIFMPRNAEAPMRAAVKAAGSHISVLFRDRDALDCDILCVRSGRFSIATLTAFISSPGKALLLEDIDDDTCQFLFEAMQDGIMIRGKKNVILISRPEMQKVKYLMSI